MASSNCGYSPAWDVYHTRQHYVYVSRSTLTYGTVAEIVWLRMGDLIGFEGFPNTSTPFAKGEHNALWKGERRYNDFAFGNEEMIKCDYPRFYGDDGLQVFNLSNELVGCRDSEFDQYGEVAAFGIYPEWSVFIMGPFPS